MTRVLLAGVVFFAVAGRASAEHVKVQPVQMPQHDLVTLPMVPGGRVLSAPADDVPGFGSAMLAAQWPGSYFRAAFRGKTVYIRVGANNEILHVAVDHQPPVKLVRPAAGVYRVSGLRGGIHSIRVEVATESQSAPNLFGGFALQPGEQALEPTRHARQIEFIGDSHTVGYGNSSPRGTCTNEEVWATTDASDAFGPLVARHYDADYQVNAISGHGVVRNYDGSAGDPVPVAYPYVLLNHKELYKDPAWQPEVLVLSLGTNDFSTPLHSGERWRTRQELHTDYEATYVRFVHDLRSRYPGALIVLWATEMAQGEIETEVGKVVDQLKAGGDARVAYLPVNGLSFSGCHSHPSLADDKVIAEKIEGVIDATPGAWQGR